MERRAALIASGKPLSLPVVIALLLNAEKR
jgi:hypothetical protein